MINVQIRKPNTDYACTSRIWRDKLNVSIFPALRLYGNSTIPWQQLKANWGKEVETFSLIDGDLYQKVGDNLPGDDSKNEFTLIFAKPSETSYEFDFHFTKDPRIPPFPPIPIGIGV